MTKLAQEYPSEFCKAFAQVTKSVVDHTLPQFRLSFQLLAPKVDRKRRIGDPVTWKGHRQEQAARLACSSGYQLKRGAAKPLLDVECEPGVAVQWSLGTPHPFTVQPSISEEILQNIKTIVKAPTPLLQRRRDRLQFWQQRAKDLLPATDQELRSIADPCLRRLLRGVPDYVDLQLGSCTHVTLYDELFAAAKCPDPLLLQGIRNGFPIVAEIQRSGRWPPFTKNQDPVSVQDALDRAWEFRFKIFRRCNSVPVSENLRSLWKMSWKALLSVRSGRRTRSQSSWAALIGSQHSASRSCRRTKFVAVTARRRT